MTVTYTTYRQLHTTRFQPIRLRLLGLKRVQTTIPASQPVISPFTTLKPALSITETTAKSVPQRFTKTISRWLIKSALLLIVAGSIAAASVIIIPRMYYAVTPVETQIVQPTEQGTVQGGDFNQDLTEVTPGRAYEPPVDESLPEGDWLIIPRIGVHTELRETENPDEALNVGVWHVPDFGDAGDTELPMIVAAHRFGWDWWWKDEYWKYNSFYLLPDTEPGDRIEVIANQQKWIYEIYAGEEGDEITDYDADLILYTCKFLNSPVRHFRYAKLIDPTVDSQQISQN